MTALHVLSGGAAQGLVGKMTPAFEAQTGLNVNGTFGAVGIMKGRLLDNAPCDVAILTAALVNELAATGHVIADSATALGSVSTGIAVKTGEAMPPVATADDLRAAFRAARGIYHPDPVKATAGIHFMKVLTELGLAEELAARLRPFPNGNVAMTEMARANEAGLIGCTQITEIVFTPGVELVAPLPAPFGLATIYTAAVTTRSTVTDKARALIALMSAPEAGDLRRACGFD